MSNRVFNDASIPEEERRAALIAHHVLKHDIRHFNARKARQEWGLSDLRVAAKVDAALNYLEEAGWVRLTGNRQGPTKGRASKNYDVNPRVFSWPRFDGGGCSGFR